MVYQGEWACPRPEVGVVSSKAERGFLRKSGCVQTGSGRGLSGSGRGSEGLAVDYWRGGVGVPKIESGRGLEGLDCGLSGKWACPTPEVGVVFGGASIVYQGNWACPRQEVGVVYR